MSIPPPQSDGTKTGNATTSSGIRIVIDDGANCSVKKIISPGNVENEKASTSENNRIRFYVSPSKQGSVHYLLSVDD